jgi:hypothetical protein
MSSVVRTFPGHIGVLGDTWVKTVETGVGWTPTGRTWGSESKPFEVSDGTHLGIAKPGEAKTDSIARAAHEKIISDLAYFLGLPVPPVVLWRRPQCPPGAHPLCSISATAFVQPVDLGPNMNQIVGPLLDDARRIASAIAAFDSWVGVQDRNPGNAIIDANVSNGLKMAFIDYSHSLSHTWKSQPGWNQFVNTFAVSFGGILSTVVEEVIDLIVALPREAIESVVQSIPDEFMPAADRQLVVAQLLPRRATLRSVCGLP